VSVVLGGWGGGGGGGGDGIIFSLKDFPYSILSINRQEPIPLFFRKWCNDVAPTAEVVYRERTRGRGTISVA